MVIFTLFFIAIILLAHGPLSIKSEGASEAAHRMLKAAERGDTDVVVDYLLNKHVILSTKNNYGVSAIIFAANNGHLDLVEALLDIGADIDDRSNNWRTPLIWSSLWGHYPVVEMLVERGANMSVFDIEGMTPLLSAVRNGHIQIVKYLLDQGADATAKNFYNGTALSIARTRGDKDMIDLLQPYFASVEKSLDPYEVLFELLRRESSILLQVLKEEFSLISSQAQHWIGLMKQVGPDQVSLDALVAFISALPEKAPDYIEQVHNWMVKSQIQLQLQLQPALFYVSNQLPGLYESAQSQYQSLSSYSREQYAEFKKGQIADKLRELGAFARKQLDRLQELKQQQQQQASPQQAAEATKQSGTCAASDSASALNGCQSSAATAAVSQKETEDTFKDL